MLSRDNYHRYLQEEVNRLNEKNRELRADRDLYRTWFMGKIEWFLELMETGKTPNLRWLVNNMAVLRGQALP